MFAPSKYQTDIYSWVQSGKGDCVVDAKAGSGKTSTLVEISKLIRGSAIFLAFNAHIRDELKTRLPSNIRVSTIHSLGMQTLIKSVGKFRDIDKNKYSKICREVVGDYFLRNSTVDLDRFVLVNHLKTLTDFCRLSLTNPRDLDAVVEMVEKFSLEIENFGVLFSLIDLAITEGNNQARLGKLIDFTDQIYLPWKWELQPNQYDWTLTDEAQDLNSAQLSLVMKCARRGGRRVFVGDPNQCQPTGTMVRLANGHSDIPIEKLKIGDEIVTYDRKGSTFVKNGKVTEITARTYSGYLIKVSTNEKSTLCTPNHKWLVRWTNKSYDVWITYLMRQGTRFRIGQTRLFLNTENIDQDYKFGLASRARQERADAAWILNVHHAYEDALAYEEIVSAKFGIPQAVFYSQNCNIRYTQQVIDQIYNALHPQVENAIKCLQAHGRDIKYPIYTKEVEQKQGRKTIFETQACNFISGYMAIPVAPDIITSTRVEKENAQRDKWYSRVASWEAVEISQEHYSGFVYSLNVESHHKYVADGLVTCNSIYMFAGANSDSIQQIIEKTQATVLPLSVCYRCPTSHIDLAQKLVPEIEAAPNAIDGELHYLKYEELFDNVREGDLIISRKTSPLVKLCIQLISKRIPASVKGRDIGKQLGDIIDDVSAIPGFFYKRFGDFLERYREDKISKLMQRENPEALLESLNDRVDAIQVCYESFDECKDTQCLKFELQELFSDTRTSVLLAVVHRVKGLEENRVMILDPSSLPLVWKGQSEDAFQQELNLKYVGLTRAKQTLFFVEAEKKKEKPKAVSVSRFEIGESDDNF